MDHVRKLVSISLLLFALVDLGVPGICKADLPAANDPVSAACPHTEGPKCQTAQGHLTILCPHVKDSNSAVDQCFCCSNIVPGSHLSFLPAYAALGEVGALRVEAQVGYSARPHYPPRS